MSHPFIENDVSGLETLIGALCDPSIYPHPVQTISQITTHISWVLLTGQFAYKIKKPVNFGFLDFSTLQKRLFFCQEEVRLNQRLTKDLYLEVVPITGTFSHPEFGGNGDVIEYAVKMRQFPSGYMLNNLAVQGELSVETVDQIVDIVADFHASITTAETTSPYGDSEDIKHWFDENFDHIRPLLNDEHQLLQLQTIQTWGNAAWLKLSALMQERKMLGYVRECHGDLHLGNMTLINNTVTLFDCIEFNPMLRWVDVISEVAFLTMDFAHFGYHNYAHRFLNRYLQRTGDYQGLILVRYYQVYRAMVRAKISRLRISQPSTGTISIKQAKLDFSNFANLAEYYISHHQPILIITHGFSGSGKSTVAGQLADKIGVIQIRSDIERKRLFGYSAQATSSSTPGRGLYTPEADLKTYQYLAKLATISLKAGFSTIIDATFLKHAQRQTFQKLAADFGASFLIVDFQASIDELCRRIKARQQDASEATIEVLLQQQTSAEALLTEELTNVIGINSASEDVLQILIKEINRHWEKQI